MTNICRLSRLKRHQSGPVLSLRTDDSVLRNGLEEQGFLEGTEVEVLERGLFGGTPIAVRVGRAIVALRAKEAEAVEVQVS